MLNEEDWKDRLDSVGYSYREKQYQFYKNCCDAFVNEYKINIVKGNMGLGKTVSVLEALKTSDCDKLIISTSNNKLKDIWSKELKGFPEFEYVIFRAKKETCYYQVNKLPAPDCNFDDCKHKHFNNSPCEYMQNWKKAFESKIIIVDYNYLIRIPLFTILNAYRNRELGTREKEYFSSAKCFVLFDEAHTLPSRIDGMYEKRLDLLLEYEKYEKKLNSKLENLKKDLKGIKQIILQNKYKHDIKKINAELNDIKLNFSYILYSFKEKKGYNFNKITPKTYEQDLYIRYTYYDFINGIDKEPINIFLEYLEDKASEGKNKKDRDIDCKNFYIDLYDFFNEWFNLYNNEEQKIFQYMYYKKNKNTQEIYFFPQNKTKRLVENLNRYKTTIFLSGTIINEDYFIHETIRNFKYKLYDNLSEFDVKDNVKYILNFLSYTNKDFLKHINVSYQEEIKKILDGANKNNENTVIVCASNSKCRNFFDLLKEIYPRQIVKLYGKDKDENNREFNNFDENFDEFLNENPRIGILCLNGKGVEGCNYKNKENKLNLKNIIVIDLPFKPNPTPSVDKKKYLDSQLDNYGNKKFEDTTFLVSVLSNLEKIHQVVYRGKRDKKDQPNIYLCGSKYENYSKHLPFDLRGGKK